MSYKVSLEAGQCFGWVYQANTGMFGLRSISPDTSLSFRQPTCASRSGTATPCLPKTDVFDHKRYLVLSRRESTDSKFPLDRPYDFLGRPKDGRFCGNTISMNTVPYYNTVTRKNSGLSHTLRSLDIDTTTIPNYEDVDSSDWDTQRDRQGDQPKNSTNFDLRHLKRFLKYNKLHKTFKKKNHHNHGVKSRRNVDNSEDNSQHKCAPNSDRIEIDEIRNLDNRHDKSIKIRTGEGKDIFSIGGRVEDTSKTRTDLLNVDLGSTDEANVFSVGYLLDLKESRGELFAGVKFDNANGQGNVCYLKNDLQSYKCVGNVRGVTVFKGSRFHDTVIIGGHGPFTVIQNYGANEYHYRIDELEKVLQTRNAVDDMCPGEWSHHKVDTIDYCYQLINAPTRNFDLAQEICQGQGASLAIITDREENDFVKNVKPSQSGLRWIGLVDNYKQRSYRWVDGTEMTKSSYTNFYQIRWQPVDAREDCVSMGDDGQWHYSKCDANALSFTCKKAAQDSTSCSDAGWQHHEVQGNSYCYRVFGNEIEEERKTWFGAWRHCREQDADLTSIVDEEENNFVSGLTSHSQYIGLENTWQRRLFFWADGSSMQGGFWATGEPDDNEYQEHCVLVDGGKWKDWNCINAERFTCQKEPAQIDSRCESDWDLHEGSCYLSVSSAKSWSEAKAHCTDLDGWLVKADTSEKNNYINELHNDEASWIGLRDNKHDRKFGWTDNSDLDYTNWLDRMPDFEYKYQYQHCVSMDGEGRWIPSICKDSERHARRPICKKKALPRVTYEIMDISREGRPVVKIVIPDSMSDATVQYDKQEMFVDIKHPTLGHVARIDISRDLPEAPDVFKIRGSSSSCVGHTPLL